MAIVDRNIKDFIEAIESRVDKVEYKKTRGEIRRNSDGCPREMEIHHVIPIKIASHWVVLKAKQAGWKINDFEHNGIPLPANMTDSRLYNLPCHRRGYDHSRYTEAVAKLLDDLETEGKKNDWNDRRVRNELEKVLAKIILTITGMKGGQYLDEISFSSSGGCYIATATLTGGGSEAQLNVLREWRDRVMAVTIFGRGLEAFYDKTGPTVANHVKHNPTLANSFLYPFVKPAIWLIEMRSHYPALALFFDLAIYTVFLTGLVYGTAVYLFHPKS